MGWGSGSALMDDVIRGLLEKKVPDESRKAFYEVLIPAMQDRDWDTEMDCLEVDPVYDKTLEGLHPTWFQMDGEE